MNKKLTLVLAENKYSYDRFLSSHKYDSRDYRYIGCVTDILGYHDTKIIALDRAWANLNYIEIRKHIIINTGRTI